MNLNLNLVFLKSMNLNLNLIFSKSMNLNLNLNLKIKKKMNGSNPDLRYSVSEIASDGKILLEQLSG